jgi:hypothetical protein
LRNITKLHKGNYIRQLIFVTAIALPLLMIFIFLFVIPAGSQYKNFKKEIFKLKRELLIAEKNHKTLQKDLYNIELGNHYVLKEFRKPKSMVDFKNDNPYIRSFREIKDKYEDTKLFTKRTFKIQTKYLYSTLENFFDLLENSDKYEMRFTVDFPIKFRVDKHRKLAITFNLNLYKAKPLPKREPRPYKDIQK